MLKKQSVVVALASVVASILPAHGTQYFELGLHERVQVSDTIVLARIVDPVHAIVDVERVLKGEPAKQIVLVSYVDGFAGPDGRKALVLNTRELLFLRKHDNGYAPVQNQFGRLSIDGDRVIDSFRAEPRSLSNTIDSIECLVEFQTRATRGGAATDAAYLAALKHHDAEVQLWALSEAMDHVKTPSAALVDALLARWPARVGPVMGPWNAAGLIANTILKWRLPRTAPFFARILADSTNGDERAWAAMALGGTGDRGYLPLLRRVASEDAHPQARALAYNGIMNMLGPESLADLRAGAKDPDEHVRAQAVVDAYNLLERGNPEPRWPPPSDALMSDVRAFLSHMQQDPVPYVSGNASSMLAKLSEPRP